MKFQIIIPVKNNWQYTKECLDTMESSYDFGITIVDTGSTDQTLFELKQNYPHIKIIEVEFKSVFFKMLFNLIALVILIVATYYFFKRFTKMKFINQNQNSNIKILEKRVLSPKSILYLIEIDGKKSLISESHLEVRKIKDL